VAASFDSIPHDELLKSVARRIVDRHVLRLIKLWLKAPIEERDEGDGTRRIGGGKSNTRGTPQGGVASPLLANIYMNRFLKYWRLTRRGEAFRAHVVAYADDFVILSRGRAAEALAWTKSVTTRLGLTLNEGKTSLKNARQERFDFLGYCVLQRHIERRASAAQLPHAKLHRVLTREDDHGNLYRAYEVHRSRNPQR
jgi:RNA-directed DNA polymerase